jgi:hypothetical protein
LKRSEVQHRNRVRGRGRGRGRSMRGWRDAAGGRGGRLVGVERKHLNQAAAFTKGREDLRAGQSFYIGGWKVHNAW